MSANVLVTGASEPAIALAAALTDCGIASAALRLGSTSPSGEGLAGALVELERAVEEQRAKAIVALAPGDAATAAALVAGKARIRLYTLAGELPGPANAADGENRGVELLSSARFASPVDGPALVRAAREIAAALADEGAES